MAVRRLSKAEVHEITENVFRIYREAGRPMTQDACCDIGALASLAADDGPWDDEHILKVAAAMAKGLFGPAFKKADEGQRWTWIDMCERALRRAIA